eukprot:GHVT01047980.1.p1 GENE.GHVT01047980.1~~GHVT01047980.1.p1  ORF type:complete len:785 (-),score=175.15 GHVT01047980.1:695-3049(-)
MVRLFFLQTDDTSRIGLQQTFRPWTSKTRVIHTQCAYAKVTWTPPPFNASHASHVPYTGLLNQRSSGILSISKSPNAIFGNFSSSMGIGLKLLRDYSLPGSLVAMTPMPVLRILFPPSAAQWNILDGGVACTHVSQVGGLMLSLGSRTRPHTTGLVPSFFTRFRHAVGLLNLANQRADGTHEDSPNVPFALCLKAPETLVKLMKDQAPWDHPVVPLRNLEPGTTMYEIFAIDHPSLLLSWRELQQSAIPLGSIVMDSSFISSRWGDQHWFVQHQTFEDDVALRKDWQGHMHALAVDGWAYMPLATSSPATWQQLYQTYRPLLFTGLEMLVHHRTLFSFLGQDVGFKRIIELMENTEQSGPNSNNPNAGGGVGSWGWNGTDDALQLTSSHVPKPSFIPPAAPAQLAPTPAAVAPAAVAAPASQAPDEVEARMMFRQDLPIPTSVKKGHETEAADESSSSGASYSFKALPTVVDRRKSSASGCPFAAMYRAVAPVSNSTGSLGSGAAAMSFLATGLTNLAATWAQASPWSFFWRSPAPSVQDDCKATVPPGNLLSTAKPNEDSPNPPRLPPSAASAKWLKELPPGVVAAASAFATAIGPRFAVDGHFLIPQNIQDWPALLLHPELQSVWAAAAQDIVESILPSGSGAARAIDLGRNVVDRSPAGNPQEDQETDESADETAARETRQNGSKLYRSPTDASPRPFLTQLGRVASPDRAVVGTLEDAAVGDLDSPGGAPSDGTVSAAPAPPNAASAQAASWSAERLIGLLDRFVGLPPNEEEATAASAL